MSVVKVLGTLEVKKKTLWFVFVCVSNIVCIYI